MSLHEPLPRLDLGPAVLAPLSPYAPSDYLRLARWLSFSPQSVKSFVPGTPLQINLETLFTELWNGTQSIWVIIQPEQFRLLFMCSVLSLFMVSVVGPLCTIFLFGYEFIREIGISALFGITVALLLIGAAGCLLSYSEAAAPIYSAIAVIMYGTMVGMVVEVAILAHTTDFHLVTYVYISAFVGIVAGGTYSIVAAWYIDQKNYLIVGASGAVALAILCGGGAALLLVDKAEVATTDIRQQLLFCTIAGFAGFIIAMFRCDDWLFSFFTIPDFSTKSLPRRIPMVTAVPIPHLQFNLENWLELNWENGLSHAHRFWQYTRQQYTVAASVNQILAEVSEAELIKRVAYFADQPTYDWGILIHRQNFREHLWQYLQSLRFSPAQAANKSHILWKKRSPIARAVYRKQHRQLQRAKEQQQIYRGPKLPIKSAAQATIAGFYFLTINQIEKARSALENAPSTPYCKEMLEITKAFQLLHNEENILNSPVIKLPQRPRNPERPMTWTMLETMQDIVRFAWLYHQCSRKTNRQTIAATIHYRLSTLRNHPHLISVDRIKRVDQTLFSPLLARWQAEINTWFSASRPYQPMKPVANPFIFARPLRESYLHVGRESEMQRLQEAWLAANRHPTVVHGLPLTGKTSLVLNAGTANSRTVLLAWLDAKHMAGNLNAELSLLSEICTATGNATFQERLDGSDLAAITYRRCEAYIHETCVRFYPRKLVIAIDGFDTFFEQVHTAAQQKNILEFLWHLHQSIANLNLTFIIRRSPERLILNNRHPFGRIARSIFTKPLDRKTTHKLLQRPPTEYVPQFTSSATYQIYRLTGGQPYLTQLLGHLVVQEFHQLPASTKPEPLFTATSVRNALTNESFGPLANNYFNDLITFIAREDQTLRRLVEIIALHPFCHMHESRILHGMPDLSNERVREVLQILRDWGILAQKNNLWSVKSSLFRNWIRTNTA
jgi:hypothetical protein